MAGVIANSGVDEVIFGTHEACLSWEITQTGLVSRDVNGMIGKYV